jgi:ketosteroid isomerase-like protein
MSEQQKIQLAQQTYAAFGTGDFASLLELIAEDVEWYLSGSEYISHTGTYRGHDKVFQVFKYVGETLELHKFEPLEFIAQGDQVVVIGHALGRIRPTNRTVAYDWIHVFTFRDSKIVKFRDYFDTAVIAEGYRGAKTKSFAELVAESEEFVSAST